MAKGQQRRGREAKKPKQPKKPVVQSDLLSSTPSALGAGAQAKKKR